MMEGKNGFTNLSTRKIKASLSTQKVNKNSITIKMFFKIYLLILLMTG